MRCQKKRRKRYRSGNEKRGQIIGKISISKRPKEANEKLRLGDWEADTIIGAGHKQAIVSVVERKTQFTLLKKIEKKTSNNVTSALTELMEPFNNARHTLTVDNGKEFAGHADITKTIATKVYFADPYSAWQRGLNENTNGLIRQYVPKGSDIRTFSDEQIEYIMDRLNNRPRKSLGFLTPNEVFYERKKLTG